MTVFSDTEIESMLEMIYTSDVSDSLAYTIEEGTPEDLTGFLAFLRGYVGVAAIDPTPDGGLSRAQCAALYFAVTRAIGA